MAHFERMYVNILVEAVENARNFIQILMKIAEIYLGLCIARRCFKTKVVNGKVQCELRVWSVSYV